MSEIPNYGAALPKQYRGASVGDIKDLGIKKLFRKIVLGPSYSGKHNLCMFILKHSPNTFAHLHVIARNKDQELYDYLRDKLEGFITFYDSPPDVDHVRRTPINSGKVELVIIDDYSNDKLLQKNVFSHFFTRVRHHKPSTSFLSHSYFATDKMIRLISEYVAILKANSKSDLQMVVKDFNIPGVTETSIVLYYNKASANKGQMLFIDSVRGELRYNFNKAITMTIQSGSFYASDFNINSLAFANTTFNIEVPTAATTSTISVSLADGWYSDADINRNSQTGLVGAGAYLIDGSGNNVYYIQLEENSAHYACQVDRSPTPTTLGTYKRPAKGLCSSTCTGLPTTTRVPRLIIDNAAIGRVLGFSTGTYPTTSSTTAVSLLSNIIPQVHPSRPFG